jgi:5'-phosphate synthase pdxT subunit
MKVGVVAFQGAVSEHVLALQRTFSVMGISGSAKEIRRLSDLDDINGLIIPGGESTTISKLMIQTGTMDKIRELAKSGVPIMGTCAGCILLAKEGDLEVKETQTQLLGLMDMRVSRNAFGRQKESFETTIDIKGFETPYRAVFIRSPAILKVWGNCKPLAFFEDNIVLAREDNLLACAFHPELTDDVRIHTELLRLIMDCDF